jgi:hypothetical protein
VKTYRISASGLANGTWDVELAAKAWHGNVVTERVVCRCVDQAHAERCAKELNDLLRAVQTAQGVAAAARDSLGRLDTVLQGGVA